MYYRRKEKDLMSLLIYILEVYHQFYQDLKTKINMIDPIVLKEKGE